jgi:hypothetical protein
VGSDRLDHFPEGFTLFIALCVSNRTPTAMALTAGSRRAQRSGACLGSAGLDGCSHAS